jgi:16S rRNA (guanine527-N7)-methyltransferase
MTADALATLSHAAREWGVPLDETALGQIESYLKSVQEKNATTNLTADDGWDDLVLKHAADGVYAATALRRALPGNETPRVLDLGSGGGFVGICLKIAWPQADVTLMEAVERKYKFLNAACAATGLRGLRPLWRRAGDGKPRSSYESDFDAVVERALAPLPEAVTLAFPMLKPGGLFAAFQTDAPDAEEPALARALAGAGARVLDCVAYRRPGEDRDRRLAIFARKGD